MVLQLESNDVPEATGSAVQAEGAVPLSREVEHHIRRLHMPHRHHDDGGVAFSVHHQTSRRRWLVVAGALVATIAVAVVVDRFFVSDSDVANRPSTQPALPAAVLDVRVVDWVSGRTIQDAVIGEQSGGTVSVAAPGYVSTSIVTTDASQNVVVRLVPDMRTFFLSNRSGTVDLYSSYVNGDDAKLVMKGGVDAYSMTSLSFNPSSTRLAVVSPRESVRGWDNETLTGLYVMDTTKNDSPVWIDRSPSVSVLGWTDNTLVFSALRRPTRDEWISDVVSYDLTTGKTVLLAQSGWVNAVVVGERVVHAQGSWRGEPAGVYSVAANGKGKRLLLGGEANVVQRSPLTVSINAYESQKAVIYDAATGELSTSPDSPFTAIHRQYVESPSGDAYATVQERDGRSDVYLVNAAGVEQRQVTQLGNVEMPVHWLNSNHLVVRVNRSGEYADYIVAVEDGAADAQKMTNVYRPYGERGE